MRSFYCRILSWLFLSAAPWFLWCRPVGPLEFIDKPAGEILFALSALADQHLLPDSTVNGTVSFFYAGGDGADALELFLSRNQLYRLEGEYAGTVSRVKVTREEAGTISVNARNVAAGPLIRSLSENLKVSILSDPLPEDLRTLHLEKVSLEEVLEVILGTWDGWEITRQGPSFFLNNRVSSPAAGGQYFNGKIERNGESFSVNITRGSFHEALSRLFRLSNDEYSLLGEGRTVIENFKVSGRSFPEILDLLCEQGRTDWYREGEIFYVFDLKKQDPIRKFQSFRFLPLLHRSVPDLQNLVPPELIPPGGLILDREKNGIVLFGTDRELSLLQECILTLDNPREDWEREIFSLNYMSPEDLQSYLAGSFPGIHAQTIPGESKRILLEFPGTIRDELLASLLLVDRPAESRPVRLKYLESTDLIKSLPPGIGPEDILTTRDPALIFFLGDHRKTQNFIDLLSLIDRPVPQIRYDLLVIQYQENRQFNNAISLSNNVLGVDDQTAFLGFLGEVLSLNFDITSALGYSFALELNSDLSESRARVMADTTLNGLSGQRVRFQNTSTYRYRDTVKDLETGNQEVTGISREITSGLFLDIEGRISGDDMITMTVSTTISKREEGTQEESGALPPTSEKIVQTCLRTPSGVPVILGGLLQQDTRISLQQVPLLGNLPLVGFLFQKRREIRENTELVIYILPHREDTRLDDGKSRLEGYYEKYGSWFE